MSQRPEVPDRPSHLPVGPLATAALAAALLAGCQTVPVPPTSPERVGEFRPGSGYLKCFLERQQLSDSLALLPLPAAEGSAERAADLAIHRATRALRDSPRWALAVTDNNLKFPKAGETFACALGLPISAEAAPHLTILLRRSLLDARLAAYGAKDHYKRQRPFAARQETTCPPQEEAMLRNDGSYPSGHSAVGWAWALVLAELAPDRAVALLQRGSDCSWKRQLPVHGVGRRRRASGGDLQSGRDGQAQRVGPRRLPARCVGPHR